MLVYTFFHGFFSISNHLNFTSHPTHGITQKQSPKKINTNGQSLVFTYICCVRNVFFILFLILAGISFAQDNGNGQAVTQLKVKQLIEKKATYNKMNEGEYDGYRIKIHFGSDRNQAREIKTKFSQKFNDYPTYEGYDQPNFIITVGDFRTKLEAFEALKKIQMEFPNSFIVKSKIKPMKV